MRTRHTAIFVVCIVSNVSASSLECFVKYASSNTSKNMCEKVFHQFPAASDAAACASQCIAEDACVMFAWQQTLNKCRLSSTCTEPTNALVGYDGYFRNTQPGNVLRGLPLHHHPHLFGPVSF